MLISTVLLSRGGRWWRWRGWYGTAAHGRPPHSKLTGLGLIPANTRLKTFITSSAPHAFSSSFNSQSSIPHHHATEEVGKDKTFVTRWLHCNDPRKEMTNVHRALHCIALFGHQQESYWRESGLQIQPRNVITCFIS